MRLQMALIGLSFLLMGAPRIAHAQSVDMKEIERDWEFLEQGCKRRVIRFTLTWPPTKTGKRPLPQSGRCVVDGPSVWVSVGSYTTTPPQHDEVYGMHRDYAFQLARRKSDSPYLLTSLGKREGPNLETVEDKMNSSHTCNLPWAACYKPLRAWLKEPGFQLKSVRREVEAGLPLVVLESSYSPPNGKRNSYFERATIKLDPANHHRFHSAQGKFNLGTFSDKAEYAENDEGRPVPVRYIQTQEIKGRKSTSVCEYHEWKYPDQPIPESDLGLTAFGLPEPAWSKPPAKSMSWVWISAACVGSVALATLFFWLRRRDAARTAH